MKKVSTSYVLWAIGLISPISGLHRLYNGKIVTGVIWLCTLGLFRVGQFVDVFLIPGMVEEYNTKARQKLGIAPDGTPLPHPNPVTLNVTAQEVRESLRMKLLKAAASRGGKLSVTQGVMATGANFAEVEGALNDMFRSGYVTMSNHPESGIVIYDFHEL